MADSVSAAHVLGERARREIIPHQEHFSFRYLIDTIGDRSSACDVNPHFGIKQQKTRCQSPLTMGTNYFRIQNLQYTCNYGHLWRPFFSDFVYRM